MIEDDLENSVKIDLTTRSYNYIEIQKEGNNEKILKIKEEKIIKYIEIQDQLNDFDLFK